MLTRTTAACTPTKAAGQRQLVLHPSCAIKRTVTTDIWQLRSTSQARRPATVVYAQEPAQVQPTEPKNENDEEAEGLLPEEDEEIRGNYEDALNPQTKLGKAVRAAVDELDVLGQLEMENLKAADELLKKLGLKSSLFGVSPPMTPAADKQEHEQQ